EDILYFKVNTKESLVNYYKSSLGIGLIAENSTVIQLSIQTTVPKKSQDFLNRLAEHIIESDLQEKNHSSDRTIDFIDRQLSQNTDSLRRIEGRLQAFRNSNAPLDFNIEGQQLFANIQGLEKQQAELMISKKYYDYLENTLRSESSVEDIVVPSAAGLDDPVLSSLISEFVKTKLELKSMPSDLNNPLTEGSKAQLSRRVTELKSSILINITNVKAAQKIKIDDLKTRINQYNTSLQKLPAAERRLINIQRTRDLSENIYLLLMEKRMEAAITSASNTPDYKLVNEATVMGGPIKPLPTRNYILALILAILLPSGVIVGQDLLNDRLETKDQLLSITNYPLLGLIPKSKEFLSLAPASHSKSSNGLQNGTTLNSLMMSSSILESFRAIRSNLRYVLPNDRKGNLLVVTSSISEEGKSFCSFHLAVVFGLSQKKVLLINADLRKAVSEDPSTPGLSDYLAGQVSVDQVVNPTGYEGVSRIGSGAIPPNPAELLLNSNMQQLIKYGKEHYDLTIIDTPPLGVVADAVTLMNEADVNMLVVRRNRTRKSIFRETCELFINDKIKNLTLVFNDIQETGKRAKYGYGYYYTRERKLLPSTFKQKSTLTSTGTY
ncbi:MAG: polysaccharide biosynthesis tyrosine autokinase, partial [Bacteroidota bacterium]